jgi:hypothetical protein
MIMHPCSAPWSPIPRPASLSLEPGGLRKIRWAVSGKGKRSGVRVIYYGKMREGIIWMLTIYGKNVEANIPAHILRRIKEEMNA